jgi:hypothetical protein
MKAIMKQGKFRKGKELVQMKKGERFRGDRNIT